MIKVNNCHITLSSYSDTSFGNEEALLLIIVKINLVHLYTNLSKNQVIIY